MDILVTADTVGRCFRKNQTTVTINTGHRKVITLQREGRSLVIETYFVGIDQPVFGIVASSAIDTEIFAMGRLGQYRKGQKKQADKRGKLQNLNCIRAQAKIVGGLKKTV